MDIGYGGQVERIERMKIAMTIPENCSNIWSIGVLKKNLATILLFGWPEHLLVKQF